MTKVDHGYILKLCKESLGRRFDKPNEPDYNAIVERLGISKTTIWRVWRKFKREEKERAWER